MNKEIIKSKIWDCTILFDELDENFGDNSVDESEFIIRLLQESLLEKNGAAVEYLLYAAAKNGVNDSYVPVLCKLLNIRDEWQYKHEDIASLLGKIKSPKSVNCLYQLAKDYEISDMHSIPLKAIWSLRLIGNKEAEESLEKLTQSSDKIKSRMAKQQLNYLKQEGEST